MRMRPPCVPHVAADLLDEIDRAGDVGVDDAHDVVEVLVEEALAKAASGVGQQGVDRPPADQRIELVDTFQRGEIGLESVDLRAHRFEIPGGLLDLGLIGDHHQIEVIRGAAFGQFVTNAGGCAGNDRKGFGFGCHRSLARAWCRVQNGLRPRTFLGRISPTTSQGRER